MHSALPFITTLVECTRSYQRIYQQLKQDAEVIDFDDMEHFALAILQADNGAIAEAYRRRFSVIMVDEFQMCIRDSPGVIHESCFFHNVRIYCLGFTFTFWTSVC